MRERFYDVVVNSEPLNASRETARLILEGAMLAGNDEVMALAEEHAGALLDPLKLSELLRQYPTRRKF